MKIIALQGKSNIGKTTVITKLYHKLCSLYKRKSYTPNNQDGDFTAIFEIDTHIIGITSVGDKEDDLKKSFEIFEVNNCELCVVCCHKKREDNGSKNFIENRATLFCDEIIWYTKAYIERYNTKYSMCLEIDKINDVQAEILLNEIILQI